MSKASYLTHANIQEATAMKTSSGTKSYTWATRGGQSATPCWGPFFRSPSGATSRTETGPGVLTATRTFFEFRKPFPSVSRGNRIIAAGVTWDVILPPRVYARTFQVDVERVV